MTVAVGALDRALWRELCVPARAFTGAKCNAMLAVALRQGRV